MVDYDCGLTVDCYTLFGVYGSFCPITKWYITVVTWALMVCLIYVRKLGIIAQYKIPSIKHYKTGLKRDFI